MCERRLAVLRPLPIGTPVQLVRQSSDLVFVLLSRSKYAAAVNAPASRNPVSTVESSHRQARRPVFMSRK
jgi:hypothetical protein